MSKIKSFDSLRFILAIFICWHHAGIIFLGDNNRYFKTAHLAVDCFFILSGFLLARNFYLKSLYSQTPIGIGDFFVSRIKRLYPEFLFCLLLLFLLMKIFHVQNVKTGALPLNAIMLGSVSKIPTIIHGDWFVVVLFWLSCFLYALMHFFKEKALFLYIPVLSILSLFFMMSSIQSIGGNYLPVINSLSLGVIRGVLGLSIGIFVYMIVDYINKNDWDKLNKSRFNFILASLELLSIIEVVKLILLRKNGGISDFNIYFAFSFIIVLLFYKREFFLRFLSIHLLVKMGAISYILYLSHICLMFILSKYSIFSKMSIILMFVSSTIVSLIFAIILYYLYKKTSSFIIKQLTLH